MFKIMLYSFRIVNTLTAMYTFFLYSQLVIVGIFFVCQNMKVKKILNNFKKIYVFISCIFERQSD